MRWSKVAVVMFSLALLAASADAATYYVSTSGNDANNGAQSTPFATISHAAGIVAAGDTVYVRGGVYNGLVRISSKGTSSATKPPPCRRAARTSDGVTPRAMLPVDLIPTLATDPRPPTDHAPKAGARTRADHDRGCRDAQPPQRIKTVAAAPPYAVSAACPRTTSVGMSAAEDRKWLALVATNEVLSLDDAAQLSSAGEARVGDDRRPWTRGLRG